jgi:hypothetical protein
MAKVRYTAERTGNKSISIYPFGLVNVGDVLEVSDEVADRYTTAHLTGEYGTADDVEARWTRDELDVIARDHRLDPTEHKKKSDLAKAIWDVDKTAAGQVSKTDFERVADSEEADVAAFGDKAATEHEPVTGPEDQIADTEEGVNNG